jgi:hypothetical protein
VKQDYATLRTVRRSPDSIAATTFFTKGSVSWRNIPISLIETAAGILSVMACFRHSTCSESHSAPHNDHSDCQTLVPRADRNRSPCIRRLRFSVLFPAGQWTPGRGTDQLFSLGGSVPYSVVKAKTPPSVPNVPAFRILAPQGDCRRCVQISPPTMTLCKFLLTSPSNSV